MPPVVEQAIESHNALHTAERQWERTNGWSTGYPRMVAEYEGRLAQSLRDRAKLREEMLAFGAYLRNHGVPPEHVYPCVQAVVEAVNATRGSAQERGLRREIAVWAMEGYQDGR